MAAKKKSAKPEARSPHPGTKVPGSLPLTPKPEALTPKPEARSQKPEAGAARAKLPTPVIDSVTAIGSRILRVMWNRVPNAAGYHIRWATDAGFVNNNGAMQVGASASATTVRGLQPDTLYYVRVQALAGTGDTDSDYSVAKSAMTGVASSGETVSYLQSWLTELQNTTEGFFDVLPQLETTVLTTLERRRLLGSGVRRYGFIDKVSDVSEDYPQFWPSSVHGTVNFKEEIKERLREIETLRNLLVWLRMTNRVVGDLLLLAGDDAFRMANTYYGSVRSAARSNLPGAMQVFQMLELFWQRRRNAAGEPTENEVERDLRALLRGTKDGEILVQNDGGRMMKGNRLIVDETRKKQRGGIRAIEHGETE